MGADVVSKGELMIALKAGITSKKIVFSGVGKTRSELIYAIDKNILLINSESKSEILEIESIAKSKNVDMNPRQAHGKIEAGGLKFKVLGDNSSDFKFKIKFTSSLD